MYRRDLLKSVAALTATAALGSPSAPADTVAARRRVRPGDAAWPADADWEQLKTSVGGRLQKLSSPLVSCTAGDAAGDCAAVLKQIANPYYIGDQPALTQSSGWADAWLSASSAYAIVAEIPSDIVAAVNFARTRNLRLVVKGGGHSYQGTSCAPDSLLIWTRKMNQVTLHDAFVAQGRRRDVDKPQPAVSLGAGALWVDAYDAVTTRGGRYVQGGGCTTVGVAGLIQSGGFGSFSKAFGTAAGGLLEAEVVTADGQLRVVNAHTNSDLLWGLKGGGGGTLGVVTRLTVRTRVLPESFGGVFGAIKADSDEAYRALIGRVVGFYQSQLFNPHWGEQLVFQSGNVLRIAMVFQGLTQQQAEAIWAPLLSWAHDRPEYSFPSEIQIRAMPSRRFWDADFLAQHAPSLIVKDDRPNAPGHHFSWAGDQRQAGQFIYAYQSAWLPSRLLRPEHQDSFARALFDATRHWEVALHFNKGLAGAAAEEVVAARNTAMNPQVLDAFALAILGSEGPPAFRGMPASRIDLSKARDSRAAIDAALTALLRIAPGAGSYVAESDYFRRDWHHSFWGSNHARLAAIKRRYDPSELFIVHHGVGSDGWSDDGFTRLNPGSHGSA